MRLVYALLERPGVGGTHPQRDGGMLRATGRPREACVSDEVSGAGPHILRTRARRRRAPAKRPQYFHEDFERHIREKRCPWK